MQEQKQGPDFSGPCFEGIYVISDVLLFRLQGCLFLLPDYPFRLHLLFSFHSDPLPVPAGVLQSIQVHCELTVRWSAVGIIA